MVAVLKAAIAAVLSVEIPLVPSAMMLSLLMADICAVVSAPSWPAFIARKASVPSTEISRVSMAMICRVLNAAIWLVPRVAKASLLSATIDAVVSPSAS